MSNVHIFTLKIHAEKIDVYGIDLNKHQFGAKLCTVANSLNLAIQLHFNCNYSFTFLLNSANIF